MLATYEVGYLAHYGIKGQRWGIRRFQYENGTYTEEGKKRYLQESDDSNRSSNQEGSKSSGSDKEKKTSVKGVRSGVDDQPIRGLLPS